MKNIYDVTFKSSGYTIWVTYAWFTPAHLAH